MVLEGNQHDMVIHINNAGANNEAIVLFINPKVYEGSVLHHESSVDFPTFHDSICKAIDEHNAVKRHSTGNGA